MKPRSSYELVNYYNLWIALGGCVYRDREACDPGSYGLPNIAADCTRRRGTVCRLSNPTALDQVAYAWLGLTRLGSRHRYLLLGSASGLLAPSPSVLVLDPVGATIRRSFPRTPASAPATSSASTSVRVPLSIQAR